MRRSRSRPAPSVRPHPPGAGRRHRRRPEQAAALGVETQPAAPATVLMAARLPATLMLPGSAARAVVVPFGGVVTRLLAQEGEAVAAGQALVELHSAEYLAAHAAQRDRQARLEQAAPAGGTRYRAAARGHRAGTARHSRARRCWRPRRPSSAPAGSCSPAPPRWPGRRPSTGCWRRPPGVVHEGELRLGEPVAAGHSAALLLSGDRLWAKAQLPPTLVGRLRAGQAVRLPGGGAGRPGDRRGQRARSDQPRRAAARRAAGGGTGRPARPWKSRFSTPRRRPPGACRPPRSAATAARTWCSWRWTAAFGRSRWRSSAATATYAVVLGLPADARVVTRGVAALKVLARQEP